MLRPFVLQIQHPRSGAVVCDNHRRYAQTFYLSMTLDVLSVSLVSAMLINAGPTWIACWSRKTRLLYQLLLM